MSADDTSIDLKPLAPGWCITRKLEQTTGPNQFEYILMAGKAGLLLSTLSGTAQASVDARRVEAFAAAGNIIARRRSSGSTCRPSSRDSGFAYKKQWAESHCV